MNELNNFLSNFETRIDVDGNELLKPSDYCVSSLSETQAHAKRWEAYHNATRVIELPTREVFWDRLAESVVRSLMSRSDAFVLFNQFMILTSEKPTIDMFVPWANGKVLEEPTNPNTLDPQPELTNHIVNEMYVKLEEYQTAQSQVQFFGWKVEIDSFKSRTSIRDKNGQLIMFCHNTGIINCGSKRIQTIDDLNRECQLYKIVK